MKEVVGGSAKPKKAYVPPANRTGETTSKKKVAVSQATIDKIKSEGMSAALKKAAAGGVSASYMEGVKRMYGAARLAKATSANINAASAAKAKPKAYGANNAPAYRPATAGAAKATSTKSEPKNPYGGFSMLARAVTQGSPKGPKTAAYAAAEAKRVAAARKAEAAARAARAAKKK